MDRKIQNLITENILNDFHKHRVSITDAIGLLESIKLSLFNDRIKEI